MTFSITPAAGEFMVNTQEYLNVSKSGNIVAHVTARNTADLYSLRALATGGYAFRFVVTDALATVTVNASLVGGPYTGGWDSYFSLAYRNPGADSPLTALVGSTNTSPRTAIAATFTAQVCIDGAWCDLGSEIVKAF